MKKVYLLAIAVAVANLTYSQKSVERIYIQGGSSAWENFIKEVYLFASFEPGIVEYNNGKQYKSKFNYNKVLGTVQFIDEKGDTLSLTDEASIRSVMAGNVSFAYKPQCMQVLAYGGTMKLLKSERVRIADNQKVGGYGISNSTGTIESIDRLDTRVNFNQVDINEKILLNKTVLFYLELENSTLVPATKKHILNAHPAHEKAISAFITSKRINFGKEADLVELTSYIARL